MADVTLISDPFLQHLVQEDVLRFDQAGAVMDAWRATGCCVDYRCVDMGFVPEDLLLNHRSQFSGVQRVARSEICINETVLEKLGRDLCGDAYVAPLSFDSGVLKIALGDVANVELKDKVRRLFEPEHLEVFLASRRDIASALKPTPLEKTPHVSHVLRDGDDEEAPARFLRVLFDEALAQKSSDIHFDVLGDVLRIQRRVDGVLAHWMHLYKAYWPALLAKLKIMADLEPTEKRFPQQGRFIMTYGGQLVDCRLATHPTFEGERVVVRFLHQSTLTLEGLGFDSSILPSIKAALLKKQGLIVVTGPTGAGKTTTLHALLRSGSDQGDNIMTLEDPVEYRLDFAAQTQVSDEKGFGFEAGIASVLRQDVDVLLIGEIRTPSVAQMAMRSAMTGHQIFTSVHAPDALSTIDRLKDLGVALEDIMTYVHCIIAQRLVRRLCVACKMPSADGFSHEAVGCDACLGTGYKGRQIVAECLVMEGRAALAPALSYPTFAHSATRLIQEGITSRAEIIRILGEDVCLEEYAMAA